MNTTTVIAARDEARRRSDRWWAWVQRLEPYTVGAIFAATGAAAAVTATNQAGGSSSLVASAGLLGCWVGLLTWALAQGGALVLAGKSDDTRRQVWEDACPQQRFVAAVADDFAATNWAALSDTLRAEADTALARAAKAADWLAVHRGDNTAPDADVRAAHAALTALDRVRARVHASAKLAALASSIFPNR